MLDVAGEAANGLVGADIYFPNVEPFASNAANQRFVARTQELFKYTPDKFMALGATALQVWALAANELRTLERHQLQVDQGNGWVPVTAWRPDAQTTHLAES